MSCSLPPEILDLIIDCLRDEQTALEACCLVSKSWVPRIRKHLFIDITLAGAYFTIQRWTKAFPDPSSSPGHHTRYLWISDLAAVTSPWIRSFCHLQELRVSTLPWDDTSGAPFLKLHGLSPTLKSLRLITSTTPPSKILDLICSFPLLEDLILYYQEPESDGDEWVAPPTSPKFTGTLHLTEDIRSVARRLLALPGGLHFANITIRCPVRHAGSAIGLVSRSSDTLESLIINYLFSRQSRIPPPLDLSHAEKLKDIEFRLEVPSVQWIVMTLQTAKTKYLRQITIFIALGALDANKEVDHRERQDLDHLLKSMDLVPSFFPELVSRGVVCEMGHYDKYS